MKQFKLLLAPLIAFFVGAVLMTAIPSDAVTNANAGPGMYHIQTYSADVDDDVAAAIAAPGAGNRIVVTGVGYSITNGEDTTATIEDAAGTPVHILEFALDDECHGEYYPVWIPCSTNSAVQVDIAAGTPTGQANVVINYYIDKLGD